jgi:hypothetical protein
MNIVFLVLVNIFVFISVQAQPTGYIWPTDASPYLTSTFGETRSAHFHAGLDIKTWGKEGYNVFASKSGKIVRVAITSQGYGRTIYMQHPDETYTVYAHLQRFLPMLQSYVDSVRLLNHQFEIDLDVRSKNWFFNQGDVIGYSGSTGIGPPHLHFEIRDKHHRPINALLTNLRIKDTIAPIISSVLVLPMSDSSTIKGSKFPVIFSPSLNVDGSLNLGLIEASGPISIAINEYDKAENVSNKYASYTYTLSSEKGIHFSSTHDSFDFNESETMFIDRIPAHGKSRRSYQTLFFEEPTPVPFYGENINKGVLEPSNDTTLYQIKVSDINNNTTAINFELINRTFDIDSAISQVLDVNEWYWRNDWISLHQNTSTNLKGNQFGMIWDTKRNQRLFKSSEHQILVSRIDPSTSHSIRSPDQNLKVHIGTSTFFDTTSIGIFTFNREGKPAFSISPHSTPMRKNIYVEYYHAGDLDKNQNYQVFHFDPLREKYTHIPTKIIGKTFHISPNMLGEFHIIPDNEAPIIGDLKIRTTDYGEHRVEIRVSDELSGIDFKKSEIVINGIRGITEYDFEDDFLIYIHPNFNSQKRIRIEVTATDNAGNSRFDVFYR